MSEAPGGSGGNQTPELCPACGHNYDNHRVCGYGNPPTEGWMECPVPGCKCPMTWSVPPEVAAEIKKMSRG
jgi:hypothetical protein